jgi:phosphohistidine phosphatase
MIMRLLLLRHAKSAHPTGVDDFDRPITGEGKAAARLIGAFVRQRAIQPVLVMCSTARRAQETWDCVAAELTQRSEVKTESGLYLAQTPGLFQFISAQQGASPLMIIGHNPGLHELGVSLLAKTQTGEARQRTENFVRKFPTAALAVFDIDVDSWGKVRPGIAMLSCFVRPKDLAGEGSA